MTVTAGGGGSLSPVPPMSVSMFIVNVTRRGSGEAELLLQRHPSSPHAHWRVPAANTLAPDGAVYLVASAVGQPLTCQWKSRVTGPGVLHPGVTWSHSYPSMSITDDPAVKPLPANHGSPRDASTTGMSSLVPSGQLVLLYCTPIS